MKKKKKRRKLDAEAAAHFFFLLVTPYYYCHVDYCRTYDIRPSMLFSEACLRYGNTTLTLRCSVVDIASLVLRSTTAACLCGAAFSGVRGVRYPGPDGVPVLSVGLLAGGGVNWFVGASFSFSDE